MKYQCYSCSEKQKKSKSGGFLKDFTNSKFGKFFMDWGYNNVAGIPVVGDNLAALTKYKPQTEFGQKVNDFGNNVVKPIVDPIATTALNMAVPGLGTGINAADQAANNAQGLNENKKTGKSLNGINPLDGSRYAQTGGQVNSIKKVDGGTLNKISSTGVKAEGRLHEHGGININDEIEIEGGEGIHKLGNKTVISSDTLQDSDGYTFAEKMTELESKKGYLENRLKIEEDKGNKNTVIVLKKKIDEIDNEIKELYGKQELTAKEMGLRDKNGNPNQASQDIVPSPENPNPPGMMGKFGGSFKFRKRYQTAGTVPLNKETVSEDMSDKQYEEWKKNNEAETYFKENNITSEQDKATYRENQKRLHEVSGSPTIKYINKSDNQDLVDNNSPHYRKSENTIYISPKHNLSTEYTHSYQVKENPEYFNDRAQDLADNNIDVKKTYNTSKSIEHDAHKVIQPQMEYNFNQHSKVTDTTYVKGEINADTHPQYDGKYSEKDMINESIWSSREKTKLKNDKENNKKIQPGQSVPMQKFGGKLKFQTAGKTNLKFTKLSYKTPENKPVYQGNDGVYYKLKSDGTYANYTEGLRQGNDNIPPLATPPIVEYPKPKVKNYQTINSTPVLTPTYKNILNKGYTSNFNHNNDNSAKNETMILPRLNSYNLPFVETTPDDTKKEIVKVPVVVNNDNNTNNNNYKNKDNRNENNNYNTKTINMSKITEKQLAKILENLKRIGNLKNPIQIAKFGGSYKNNKKIKALFGYDDIYDNLNNYTNKNNNSTYNMPFFKSDTKNKLGFNDGIVPSSNLGSQQKNKEGSDIDAGGSEIYGDDGQSWKDRVVKKRLENTKGSVSNNLSSDNKGFIRNILENETNKWTESIAEGTWEEAKKREEIKKNKEFTENEQIRINDQLGKPNEGELPQTVPPGTDIEEPKQVQPKQSQYKSGEDIKAFQIWYNQRHPNAPLKDDGIYGPKTRAAYEAEKEAWRNDFHGKPLDSYKFGGIKKMQMAGAAGAGAGAATGASGSGFGKAMEFIGPMLGGMGSKKEEQPVPQQPMYPPIVINNAVPETKPNSYFDQNQFAYDRMKLQNEMNYGRAKSGGDWIKNATNSIEKRGTEGRCSGSNFGGPDCPPGSRQYNLAVTFKKMAKREMGGLINKTGYLEGYSTNKNPYNIIPSNIITTKGMKFPIEAVSDTGDKKILYPNQKEKVIFKGNYVVEKPLKAASGFSYLNNVTTTATQTVPLNNTPLNPNTPITPPTGPYNNPPLIKLPSMPGFNSKPPLVAPPKDKPNVLREVGKYAYSALPAIAGIGQFIARKNDKPFSYLNEKPQGMTEWNNSIKNSQYNLSKQFGDQQNTALATLLRSQTDNNSSSPAELNNFGANMSNEFNKYMIENNRGIMDQYQKYVAQDAALKQGERTDRYDLFAQRRKDLDQMRNDLVKSIGESVKNFGAQYNLDSNQEYIKNMIKQFPVWLQNEILQNIAEGK